MAVSATNGKKLEAANGEEQDNNGVESELADDDPIVDLEETANEEILEEASQED